MKTTTITGYVALLFWALGCASNCPAAEGEGFARTLPDAYVPGKTISVYLSWSCGDFCSFYAHVWETIPPGWCLRSSVPQATSFDPETGTIYWKFELWCVFYGIDIRYDVTPPAGQTGDVLFDGLTYRGENFLTTGDTTLPRGPALTRRVPDEYPTIQAAVDASVFGDTVLLSGSQTRYVESVELKPGVDLIGSGAPALGGEQESSGTSPAITTSAHNRVEGIRILSGGVSAGHAVEVSNCVITGTEEAAIAWTYDPFDAYEGIITNCTIVANGEGVSVLQHRKVFVTNCVFFGNGGPDVVGADVTYSCLQNQIESGSGENNVYAYPLFANAPAGDYRLLPGSPCIDTGDSSVVPPDQKDLDGNPRIMFGGRELRVDMGAYEHRAPSPLVDPFWGDFGLYWSSSSGKTYSVFFSDDLITWELAADNVPGTATSAIWFDPIGWPPTVPRRFYRIMENE